MFDPLDPSKPLYDIPSNPLAISSLSVSGDGRYSLSSSLDGTVSLVDTTEGKVLGKADTGREKLGDSRESAALLISNWMEDKPDQLALPAFACAVHPQMSCWAWSGRTSKLGMRQIPQEALSAGEQPNGHENGESSGVANPLAGEAKGIDTVKGKFGMDVKFVRLAKLGNVTKTEE